jgi:hypothetical protein
LAQLVSSFGVTCDDARVTALAILAALVIAAVRVVQVRRLRPQERTVALYEQLVATEPEIWHAVIRDYSRELGDPWHRGAEAPADVAERILGTNRWTRLTEWRAPPPTVTEKWHPDQT